ncbi:copper ion binding protein [Paenibacillus senegalensis]|uniref:copper ion binding protein n=1 Tax=Paenibacillus senegalensis TaxID=1465766 RepID=UPI00028A1922|nr:copper ion binding protein [Paenibacillus senegalensis]
MKNLTLTVNGMSCGHCVNSIESALKQMGVAAKVHLDKKTVDISFAEDQVSVSSIKEAIEEQGYEVE